MIPTRRLRCSRCAVFITLQQKTVFTFRKRRIIKSSRIDWASASSFGFALNCWWLSLPRLHLHFEEYSKTIPSVIYSLLIFSATVCSSISSKASVTAVHVGNVVLSSQQPNTSVLQRLLLPRWLLSISLSWWCFRPRCTPRECQSETDFSSFVSAFKVGVAGAVMAKTPH